MKVSKLARVVGVSAGFALVGCKSAQESAADKFLKAGDPISAVKYYEEARAKGNVSKEFWKNYGSAFITALEMRALMDADPGAAAAPYIVDFRDTALSIVRNHPDPENESRLANVLYRIGMKRLEMGTSIDEEAGFEFLRAAASLPNKPAGLEQNLATTRQNFMANRLKEIASDYEEAKSNPDMAEMGILADYKMNQLEMILGEETPEMRALWSDIRKLNLNTYLLYDLEGLVARVDPRINQYGIVLGIVKYAKSGGTVNIQVTAFNGSSGAFNFTGEGFTLVDRDGQSYEPTSVIGVLKKGQMVDMRGVSKTGGLTFKIPAGAEPHYLEYKVDKRVSRKYLP